MVVPPDRLAAVQRGVRGADGAHGAVDPVEPVGGVGRAAAERRLQTVDALNEAAAVLGVDLTVLGQQAHDGHAGARGHHDVLQHARAEVPGDHEAQLAGRRGLAPGGRRLLVGAHCGARGDEQERGAGQRRQQPAHQPRRARPHSCASAMHHVGLHSRPHVLPARRQFATTRTVVFTERRRRSSCPWPSRPRRRRCRREGP